MSRFEVGKKYAVNHSRKGSFSLSVTSIDGEWITGIITSGEADSMMDYNRHYIGDEITARESFLTIVMEVVNG